MSQSTPRSLTEILVPTTRTRPVRALAGCALERPDGPDCLTALPLDTERHGNGVVSVSVPGNARDLGSASRGMSVAANGSSQSGDLAAALAQQRGLKFAGPGGGTIVPLCPVRRARRRLQGYGSRPKGTWACPSSRANLRTRCPLRRRRPVRTGSVTVLSYSSEARTARPNPSTATSILGEGWARRPISLSATNFMSRR